jgi:cytochrome c biogenesis protein CcmG/thiol:disulfide interchange protein DsbE
VVPTDELEGYHKRSRVRRRLLAAVVATAVAGALTLGFLIRADSPTEEGREAPDWELPLLAGTGTLGSDDLTGFPVVVNFWASWCIPCREEMPFFERAWRDYRARGVRIVGVNVQDTEKAAAKFVEDFDITYPIVRDEDQSLARKMGLIGLPQTFFIDHTGRFLAATSGLGAISKQDLLLHIEKLLEGAEDG